MTLKDQLLSAATAYDRRQSTRRGYNPHALGIYFERIDEVCADVQRGASVRRALCAGFSDRLLDHLLKAVGEAPSKPEELGRAVVYEPVTK